MTPHFFTPSEANRRLPYIKKVVADILAKGKEGKALRLMPYPTPTMKQKIEELDAQIKVLLLELEAIGCSFKDWNFEIGLVDFPTVINGREMLLCWRCDEKEVAWFHGHDDGYSNRQRITSEMIFS